jgi:hypothetical protein
MGVCFFGSKQLDTESVYTAPSYLDYNSKIESKIDKNEEHEEIREDEKQPLTTQEYLSVFTKNRRCKPSNPNRTGQNMAPKIQPETYCMGLLQKYICTTLPERVVPHHF